MRPAKVWPKEFERLASRLGACCEFGTLMVRPGSWPGSWACEELFRVGWLYARSMQGCKAVCAKVQERHAPFYERRFCFERLGAPRDQFADGVRIPQVVPLWLDLDQAEGWFKQRFSSRGAAPGNLYRRFVVEGREEGLATLRAGLEARKDLDFEALRCEFAETGRATQVQECDTGLP
jgi:hypothetical protein